MTMSEGPEPWEARSVQSARHYRGDEMELSETVAVRARATPDQVGEQYQRLVAALDMLGVELTHLFASIGPIQRPGDRAEAMATWVAWHEAQVAV